MFKATAFLAAALLVLGSAHAGGKPPPKPTTPPPAASTQSVDVGITNLVGAWAQGGRGGAGGAGGIGYGGTGGSVGNLLAGGVDLSGARVGSDLYMERSAPGLYGATPTQPTQPCARPGFSIGGSSTGGGGLLSIPSGTDVTCRVDNALTIMARNPKLFSDDDRLIVSCKQEDIADTKACKDLAKRQAEAARASAILEAKPDPVAQQQPMPWQAGG